MLQQAKDCCARGKERSQTGQTYRFRISAKKETDALEEQSLPRPLMSPQGRQRRCARLLGKRSCKTQAPYSPPPSARCGQVRRLNLLVLRTGRKSRASPQVSRRKSLILLAPWVGFEPTTNRLTAGCSTVELPRIAAASAHMSWPFRKTHAFTRKELPCPHSRLVRSQALSKPSPWPAEPPKAAHA